jgi:hypothetical protein
MLETIEQIATAYNIPWLRFGADLLLLETDEERAEYFLREEGYNVRVVAQEDEGTYITSKVMQKMYQRQRAPRFVIRGN